MEWAFTNIRVNCVHAGAFNRARAALVTEALQGRNFSRQALKMIIPARRSRSFVLFIAAEAVQASTTEFRQRRGGLGQ